MNVQLILFPQWDDGVPSSVSVSTPTSGQMLSAPNNFITIGAAGTGTSVAGPITQTAQLAVNAIFPTMATNTWYSYNNSTSAGVTGVVGSALFYAGYNGIMQRVQGLTAGALYDVRLTWSSAITPQNVTVRIFNGTTFVSQVLAIPTANDDATVQFTAPSTLNTVVVIDYAHASLPNLMTSASVKVARVQPIVAIQNRNNGSVICDLYEDEDLPLSLSIDDFKNAAEQVQSYSKAFNLPATKRNNKIFDQMFEITRSDDGINFNPYKRTRAVLKENGFLLFEGYLRMIDITDKEGEISYNVNLYSEVVALADVLGDRTFADLDFKELKHEYNYSNIRNSWQGILALLNPLLPGTFAGTVGASTTGVLRYPFVDWNHKFTMDLITGNPILPNLESAFRPWISLKYCIDMIFAAPLTPFSYTSDFFNSVEFGNLYMDFNWGGDNIPREIGVNTFETFYFYGVADGSGANYASTSFSVMFLSYNIPLIGPAYTPPNYNDTTNILTSTQANEVYTVNYTYVIENIDTVSREIECRWLYNTTPIDNTPAIGTGAVVIIPAGGSYTYQGNFTQTMLIVGDTLQVQFKTNTGTASKVRQSQVLFPASGARVTWSLSASAITSQAILQTLRGELGQWQFLKGIMTMFNLVTMPDPDNPNNLLIEPYSDVFITNTAGTNLASRSIQHDWTEKIDISEMKLEPLTDLNLKTIFKFEEDDDDFCFTRYKNQTDGHLYGSLIWSAAGFTILGGEKEIIAQPFAATVIKPLEPQYTDFIVPAIYARDENNTCSGFDNMPRIMYKNGVHNLTSCTYFVPAQNGGGATGAENQYLRFSHLSAIPTVPGSTVDYLYGVQQLTQPLVPVTANLFTRFWLPYYAQLYNPDTRTMTIKVNLSAGDINTFKFNDKVFIKNRTFRVNKIDYKPNDLATVEFILLQ